jgi:hypothetical protein
MFPAVTFAAPASGRSLRAQQQYCFTGVIATMKRSFARSPLTSRLSIAIGIILSGASGFAMADPDQIIMFDGFEGCGPVEMEIGPAGGVLRRCGAEMVVPPNAVAVQTLFGIERSASAPPAPFDMELAGPAVRFTPIGHSFDEPISVRVPRDDSRRGGLAIHDPAEPALLMIEACGYSATGLQQFVGALGTYAAIRYVGHIPASTQGLGDGELVATTEGNTLVHDLDSGGDSWAVYHDLPDGSRQVTVHALESSDDSFEFTRLDFSINPQTGAGSLQQISVLGTHNGSYINGLIGEAEITFGDLSDGRLRGQIEATLESGPNQLSFEATFDVAVERFYFPPELSCPGGKPPPG